MLRTLPSNLLAKLATFSQTTTIQIQGVRLLYTADALGINGYLQQREKVKLQFTTPQMVEKFRSKMEDYLKSQSKNMIFSDDLKNMIYLAEGTPEDANILNQMIRRFHDQSSGVRFGTFVFGPVILRYFYYTNKPNEVMAMFRDPNLVGMFDQFMSYQIAMDLLLRNQMYSEVVELFSIVQDRRIQGNKFPKNCFILAMAALYQMNTPESYEKMKLLLEDARNVGHIPMRRVLTYAASLALKQQHPEVVIDILSACKQTNYITVRNLKVLGYAHMGRIDDALAIFRSALNYDSPDGKKRTFCKDVLQSMKEIINSSDNKELQLEFSRVEKGIVDQKLIENQSIDELLNTPIESLKPLDRDAWDQQSRFNRDILNASFNQRDRSPRNTSRVVYSPKRPGLSDME